MNFTITPSETVMTPECFEWCKSIIPTYQDKAFADNILPFVSVLLSLFVFYILTKHHDSFINLGMGKKSLKIFTDSAFYFGFYLLMIYIVYLMFF